ncbi:MAG TPA: helix-turn-helix domain-containing protein [Lacunisphaera sp.]|nr:helix-turn-helix domain-containing protein [Lacunisphaera sp.]
MTPSLTRKQLAQAKEYCAGDCYDIEVDPRVEALVTELLGRVADKWTMLVIEALATGGEMRFSRIAEAVAGISQKMLTQTLRQMERDGLVVRTVHPVIPPHVDYRLTEMGRGLGEAFCGVWVWAGEHLAQIEKARREFDARNRKPAG